MSDEADIALTGRFKFINLGAGKFTGETELKGEISFFRFVRKYLKSKGIDYSYDLDTMKGEVFVGYVRQVGTFERVTLPSGGVQ